METPRRSARLQRRTQVSIENGRGFSIIEKTVVDHGPYFKAYLYLLESLIPIVSWILSIVIYFFYLGKKYMRFIVFAGTVVGIYYYSNVFGVLNGNSMEKLDFVSLSISPISSKNSVISHTQCTLSDHVESLSSGDLEFKSQIMQMRGEMDNISLVLKSLEKEKLDFIQKTRMEFLNLSTSFKTDFKKFEILQDKVDSRLFENFMDSRVNYALKSRGAKILKSSSDYTVGFKSKWLKILFPRLKRTCRNLVVSVLESKMSPGDCWAMKGSNGFVDIGLSQEIIPESVVIQHVHLNEISGFNSAPKQVELFSGNILLGNGTFDPREKNSSGFLLKKLKVPTRTLRLHFLSNWGNLDYTCIYQIQVFS